MDQAGFPTYDEYLQLTGHNKSNCEVHNQVTVISLFEDAFSSTFVI